MKSRAWLILGLFLIWGAGSTYFYVCKIKGFCSEQPKKEWTKPTDEKPKIEENKPVDVVYFDKNSDKPVVADSLQWTAEVKSLAELKAEGKKLFVYGSYYKDETNNTKYENLGLARASQLKNMLSSSIDTSYILTKAKLMGGNSPIKIKGFNDLFHWRTYNNFVKEGEESVLLYFPFNSTKELTNKQILNYLDELANKLKANKSLLVNLTGHTDNIGNEQSNLKLSKKRADRIKNILVKKGVEISQITSKGMGESEPIADNSSEQGRQKNRRVEIKITK